MEREILVEGKAYRFEIGRDYAGDRISIDRNSHEVRFLPLPDGRRLCIVDGRVIEWDGSPNGNIRLVRSAGHLHHLDVIDPRRRTLGSASIAGRESRAELKAPMAGRVVEVLCEEGQEIAAEQGVVVLEAMKMENELRSPIAGIVTTLEVETGQSVETGQRVAVVDSQVVDS